MITTKSVVWHLFVLVIIIFLSILYRSDLTTTDVAPLISILQNTSAMVFTIMGIWIAYLYPNAILSILQPSKIESLFSEEDEQRVTLIVGVVALSAIVMCCLIIGTTATPFIIKGSLYTIYPEAISLISIFFLLVLSYAQLFAVYIVFAANLGFIMKLRSLRNKKILNDKLNPKIGSDEKN
jgi:hypothetical protein